MFAERLCGAIDRNAPDRNGARTAGAGTAFDAIGIALNDAHAFRRQIETFRNELRIRCGMTLAGRLRSDEQGDPAIAIEIESCGFRAIVTAGFDISRNADTAQLSGTP